MGREEVVRYLIHELAAKVNGISRDVLISRSLQSESSILSDLLDINFHRRPSYIPSQSRNISPLQSALRGFGGSDFETRPDFKPVFPKILDKDGQMSIVRTLLNSGARPNILEGQKAYPIQIAAQKAL